MIKGQSDRALLEPINDSLKRVAHPEVPFRKAPWIEKGGMPILPLYQRTLTQSKTSERANHFCYMGKQVKDISSAVWEGLQS